MYERVINKHEWVLLEPIMTKIKTMIELGNKRNSLGTYKDFFTKHGIEHTSIDWNGEDGALPLDLRLQHKFEPVDCVTNFGCTEHIVPQGYVWENIVDWVKVGGYLLSETPLPGDCLHHGEKHPTREWYVYLCEQNGFEIETLYESREKPNRYLMLRAKKVKDVPFESPPDTFMHDNEPK